MFPTRAVSNRQDLKLEGYGSFIAALGDSWRQAGISKKGRMLHASLIFIVVSATLWQLAPICLLVKTLEHLSRYLLSMLLIFTWYDASPVILSTYDKLRQVNFFHCKLKYRYHEKNKRLRTLDVDGVINYYVNLLKCHFHQLVNAITSSLCRFNLSSKFLKFVCHPPSHKKSTVSFEINILILNSSLSDKCHHRH